jgi:hypothetical protein
MREGWSGAAMSMKGYANVGSTSSATVTTSSFGKSSARSACHPGRLVRHPHQLAHATSSTFWPRNDDNANGAPLRSGSVMSGTTAVVSARPPLSGPSAHR